MKTGKSFIIAFYLFKVLGTTNIAAQSGFKQGQFFTYDVATYNISNGFANTEVDCIIQDSLGYIWVGGVGGVTRFNGKSSVTYTTDDGLPTNPVRTLFIDSKGTLWSGGFSGSPAYLKSNKFIPYTTKDSSLTEETKIYNFTETNKGIIIVATSKGIFELEKNRLIERFRKIFKEANETAYRIIWFENCFYLATKKAIWKIDEKNTLQKMLQDSTLETPGGFSVINNHGKKHLYYSSQNIYSLENDHWMKIVSSDEKSKFTNISSTAGGKLFFAKNYIISLQNNKTDTLNSSASPLLSYYFCLVDKNENIWANNLTDGIITWRKRNVSVINRLSSYSTKTETNKEGFVYIDIVKGTLAKLDLTTNKRELLLPENSLQNMGYTYKTELKNNDIILNSGFTTNKIYKISGKKIINIKSPVDFFPYSVYERTNGDIMIGGRAGIGKLSGDEVIPNNEANNGILKNQPIFQMVEDANNSLWYRGLNKLYYQNGNQITIISNQFKQLNNKTNSTILACYKNYILVATSKNRIVILKTNSNKTVTVSEELFLNSEIKDDLITYFEIDNFGNAMLQSQANWYTYIYQVTDPQKRKIIPINKEFIKSENLQNFLYLSMNKSMGLINLISDSVIIKIDSTLALNTEAVKPTLNLTKIELFKTTTDWVSKGFDIEHDNIPGSLSLTYKDNFLTFFVEGISFDNLIKLKYQYKLSQVDTGWSPILSDQFATYNNLAPGKYTFEARAIGDFGIVGPAISYSFSINPPWWATWWFKTILVLVILSSIYVYIKLRTRFLVKQNALLNDKVEERTYDLNESIKENEFLISTVTHDIKGPLANIYRLTDLMEQNWWNLNDSKKLELITDLNTASALSSSFINNFLTWLKAKKSYVIDKEIVDLNEIIQTVVNFHLKCNNMNQNKAIINTPDFPVLIKTSKQFIRIILQNIIDNAFKYTIDGEITVSLSLDSDYVTILCSDTGKGMSPEIVKSLNQDIEIFKHDNETMRFNLGWKIIKDLVKKLDATSHVENTSAGTIVTINLKGPIINPIS